MSEQKQKSVFEVLNAINVSEHIEKKNIGGGRTLSYVSWVWAWAEVKKRYPDASYKVFESNGLNYFTDGKTAYVKCSVTIQGEEIIEYLPIMTGAQRSMSIEQVTSHDVIRSIQRCVTKAIARHGLGLYVYAGEDLPEEEVIANKTAYTNELNTALSAVQSASTIEELQNAWNTYKPLQADKVFIAGVNKRKSELSTK